MSRYFHIMHGLRGCYMPDSAWIVRVETRRELKEVIRAESEDVSERNIAWLAARVWRKGNTGLYVVPTGPGYGLHATQATRAEYLEAMEG